MRLFAIIVLTGALTHLRTLVSTAKKEITNARVLRTLSQLENLILAESVKLYI